MPTRFSDIYERAAFKFTEYAFLNEDIREAQGIVLQGHLLSAIVDFQHACTVDLNNYNLADGSFNVELDNEMIDILATGVAYHWLSSKALNSELLKSRIHNKDYTSYSPANLLKEIKTLRTELRAEYRGAINTYSFRYGTLE